MSTVSRYTMGSRPFFRSLSSDLGQYIPISFWLARQIFWWNSNELVKARATSSILHNGSHDDEDEIEDEIEVKKANPGQMITRFGKQCWTF